jgi:hypothetical protein
VRSERWCAGFQPDVRAPTVAEGIVRPLAEPTSGFAAKRSPKTFSGWQSCGGLIIDAGMSRSMSVAESALSNWSS